MGLRVAWWAGLVIQRGLGLVLLSVVVVVLADPSDPYLGYNRWLVLAGMASAGVLAAAWWAVGRRGETSSALGGSGRREQWAWAAAVAVSLAAGVLAVVLAWFVRYRYGWDPNVVSGFSERMWSGDPVSARMVDYLSRYPNNLPLLALMNTAHRLGDVLGMGMYSAYLAFNGLCVVATVLLTFVLVRLLRGFRAAFAAQAVVVLLVALSPWSAVPYTDLPATPLVLGAVTLGVAALRTDRARLRTLMVVAAFALAACGYLVKTTPATTAVALGLTGLVAALALRGRRPLAALLVVCCGALTFGVVAIGGSRVVDDLAGVHRQQLDLDRTPPPVWWLANGLVTSTHFSGQKYYGSFSTQMVKDSKDLRGEALQHWSRARLARQLDDMGGPADIAIFEGHKLAFVWGDGMFFAWGEGYDYQAKRLVDHSSPARAVQAFQHPSGRWYLVRTSLTNGVWLFLLLWCAVGLLRSRYDAKVLLLSLTVLGILVFLVLFQGRSRYVFAYVPVVVALGTTVFPLSPRPSRTPVAERGEVGHAR